MKIKTVLIIISTVICTVSCNNGTKDEEAIENSYNGCFNVPQVSNPVDKNYVSDKLTTFKEVKLESDMEGLTDNDKKMIEIFRQVGEIIDGLYWKQAIGQRDRFLESIKDENTRKYAMMNYGPWDRLNNNIPFIEGVGEKPAGANFYPTDMTKEEFARLDDSSKTSGYTIIRRDKNGKLRSIWYHDIYKSELTKIADLLKEAAEYSDDANFKEYLKLRANSLLTSDYQKSDFAWMKVRDSRLDLVVGPIENYEDELYGYKCAFESFILVKDAEWSKNLSKFVTMLPELQKGLPVPDKYKKEVPGTDSDINVYDVLLYSGDCNAGGKTIAINLPNDEEVQLTCGSRKLQLKNTMKAKFDNIVVPIAGLVIDESQLSHVKFDAFFENVTFHEVGHGLGIKNTVNGSSTVREALKEQYSAIEEAKADIMGLYLVAKLYEKGEISSGELMDNFVTFTAGIFRSCRFGASDAHGKANMLIFNFFEDAGAFTRNPETGKYTVNFDKTYDAMIALVEQIITLQGDGSYEAAKKLVETQGVIRPQLQADLDRINASGIPVDIVF
ncbi:MAG: Zn-dependent hydrolase [Bacteroidales bacterium]|nr:Zn-dependent hydrolase [Bacteroidales bacterium]